MGLSFRKRAKKFSAGFGSPGFLRSRVVAIGHMMSGNVGNALIMLASLAIATRALGPEALGTMAVVLAVGRVSERLLRFESWQPLVRFGANEEKNSNPERMSRLYSFGLALDIATALLAAVLSVVAAIVLADLFGFDREEIELVAIYSVAIALNIRGMSSAVLRLSGQFKSLAYVRLVSSLVRLVLSAIFYFVGAGLMTFMAIWTFAQVLDAMLFNVVAMRTLRRSGIPSPFRTDIRGLRQEFPGFLTFAWSTNLSSTLRTVTHEADTLMVAALSSTTSAGIYHIAKRIAKTAMQIGEMVQTVVYPDLARMWAELVTDQFRRVVLTIQLVLAGICGSCILGAIVLGRPIITIVFGADFESAYPVLIAHLIAIFLILHAAPSRSALLAMNEPGFVLRTAIVATGLFLVTAWFTIPMFGPLGASLAHIAFGLLTAISLDLSAWGRMKSAPASVAVGAGASAETVERATRTSREYTG